MEEDTPHGKLRCYITKTLRKDTPEERVRQEYLIRLVEEYKYPTENIDVEVPIFIGSGDNEVKDVETGKPKRADIVIYRNKNDKGACERHYIIVECKKKDESTGKKQVKSYGNVTRAPIIVWHNGIETQYWAIKKEPNDWELKAYLPRYEEEYGDKKVLKKDLRPASNLQTTFKRIHNDIYAHYKSGNKAKVFYQVIYLLFAKIFDEKSDNDECKFIILDREFEEIIKTGESKSFKNRIISLFNGVQKLPEYKEVFEGNEKIDIPTLQIANIVSELEYITVLETDVKGEAFQSFLSAYFRGDAGQFFTPDPIKDFAVKILNPKPNEVVLDPACGSSGFLVFTINYYKEYIKRKKEWIDESGKSLPEHILTKDQRDILRLEVKNYARDHIKGIDFENDLTKVAKMYMVMVDDGHTGIHTSNSLIAFKDLEKNTNKDIKKESVNIIMTNPPFGTKGKVKEKKILQEFDFGHKWKKDSSGKYKKSKLLSAKGKTGGQVPDILFIERCVELLKPDGRMGIVLPDGDLNNQNTEFVRAWLEKKVQIVAVISVPSTAFDPYGAKGIKTSVLFVKKPKGELLENYPIFFANLEFIGYDISGRIIYVTNNKGEVLDDDGNVIDYLVNKKGEKTKQDERLIRKHGAIKSDIPQMLESWSDFYTGFKSYLSISEQSQGQHKCCGRTIKSHHEAHLPYRLPGILLDKAASSGQIQVFCSGLCRPHSVCSKVQGLCRNDIQGDERPT